MILKERNPWHHTWHYDLRATQARVNLALWANRLAAPFIQVLCFGLQANHNAAEPAATAACQCHLSVTFVQ